MSSLARYLTSVLSRLSLFAPVDSLATPVTPWTSESPPSSLGVSSLARGLILSTSSYLKSAAADPKVSLTPVAVADASNTFSSSFDISLRSDTSTSSSCSDDTLITPLRSLETNDLFSPRRHTQLNPLPATPSPPHLAGLGISGVPRRDGRSGDFDGLGLVGVCRSFHPRNPFLVCGEDDDNDDWYASPTPVLVHRRGIEKPDEQKQDDELSETFMRELVFTWEADPQHTRVLSTIPECDDEDEFGFRQAALKKKVDVEAVSSPEPTSPVSLSPSSCRSCSATSPPSQLTTPSPLTLRTAARPRVPQVVKPTNQSKPQLGVSRASFRNPHPSHTRSKSGSPSKVGSTRGRTSTQAKNPSGLRSGRDDAATAPPSKKKLAVKGAWRT